MNKVRTPNIHVLINQMWSAIRSRCRIKGWPYPTYSKGELTEWLYDNNVEVLFKDFVNSGYEKYKRPSIDRIDDYGLYEFSNMQLITWWENHIKGARSEKHIKSIRKDHLEKKHWVWKFDGELIMANVTSEIAAQYLKCNKQSLSKASINMASTLKGHIITRVPEFLPRIRQKRRLKGSTVIINGIELTIKE